MSWQYNGESSSSQSNLSAFAPPFTVSPLAPNPNLNPYEPLLGLPSNSSLSSWPSPNPQLSPPEWASSLTGREFESTSYPGELEYLITQPVVPGAADPLSYGQFLDGSRTKVDEVRPYFPQCHYSSIEPEKPPVFTNHPGFDGLCDDNNNQMVSTSTPLDLPVHVGKTYGDPANREQHEFGIHERGYCTDHGNVDDYCCYMNQAAGCNPSIGFRIHPEASNDVDLFERGKLDGPKRQEPIDAKSLGNNLEFMSMTSPTTLNFKYTTMLPATHSEAPSLDLFSDLRKDQIKHSKIDQECMTQCGKSSGDQNFVGFFPALSPGTQASAPVLEVHSANHGNCSVSASEHFSGNTPNIKEIHAGDNPEGKIFFNEALIRSRCGRNDFSFEHLKDENPQNEKVVFNDASIHLVRGNPGIEVPCVDGYGLEVSSSEAFNHFNQEVDSTCWKGMPVGNFGFPLGSSDIVPPKYLSNFKEFDGLNHQRHQAFAQSADGFSGISCERLNEDTLQRGNQSLERNSMFHQEQPGAFNPSATQRSFRDAMETGSPYIRQENDHCNELTSDYSFESSQTEQNSCEPEVKSEERRLFQHEGSDKERNISDDANNGFSNVSFQCVERVLSSPPEMAATNHSGQYREELAPKIDASMVVRMMHNLSELLMFCSSNGSCDLKEQDCEFLKDATNNMIVFCLENRHLASRKNMDEPRITFLPDGIFLGEYPGVHATLVEVKRPEPTGKMHNDQEEPFSIPPSGGGEKRHFVVHNYPKKTSLGCSTIIGQSSGIRDDQMTQSVVAEGPQASGNPGKPDGLNNSEKHYGAPDHLRESSSDHSSLGVLPDSIRDDKMIQAIKTIFVEYFHEEEEAEPQVELFKNLWLEAEAALCSLNYRARYDRVKFEMERFKSQNAKGPSKNTIKVKDHSSAGVFANLSSENKSADDASKNHENLNILGQNFCPTNDVMARFNILKDRDSKLNLRRGFDGEELPSPKVPCNLKKADEVALETCKSPTIPTPTISTVKGSAHQVDKMESSIFSRLSILKQREENLSSAVDQDPDLSQDISSLSPVGQRGSAEASTPGSWLSILKQQEDHLSPLEMEARMPLEAVNVEASVLARLSILMQRDGNLSSGGWDCTPPDVVNLESAVQKDYFPSIGEKTDTSKNFSSGFTNDSVPGSRTTGGSENPMHAARSCDFSSSSDWEHVVKDEEV